MSVARRRPARLLVPLLALALLAGACGGKEKASETPEEVGDPVRGGEVTYALEAETGDGWCLPEAQLAISGIMVARTIYDTLTAPGSEGEYVPYLAEAVTPNDTYDEWTITLREGITFHDGSPLTAEVVKNNLDAYRGVYPNRPKVLLFRFVLDNIDTVEATGELEVTVTTKVPWVAFPAFLFSSGRLGIVGQAQLDDAESCDSELIGTGPFELERWERDQRFVATANPDYWQMAPDGKPYPYLERITYVPQAESEQRVNGIQAGDLDLAHFSSSGDVLNLRDLRESGEALLYESDDLAEVEYLQLNVSKAPFDDIRVREAIALAIDPDGYNEQLNDGIFTMANGPFAPGAVGHLDDTGWPDALDLEGAKALVEEYEAEKGPISVTLQNTPSATAEQQSVFVQQRLRDVGIEVTLQTVQQDQIIDNAIGGNYDMSAFRNFPGGDPDELYVWFKGGSPVNFGRFVDPEIDRLLDEGRSEADPAARKGIYEEINRRFASQYWSTWLNWTTWTVAGGPDVHGYDPDTMPDLPDGSRPSPGLATGHPVHGLWVAE